MTGTHRLRRIGILVAVASLVAVGAIVRAPHPARSAGSPITHVVILYQENHSFEDRKSVV